MADGVMPNRAAVSRSNTRLARRPCTCWSVLGAAAGAGVDTLVVHMHVLPGEGTLRARLAEHRELLRRQTLTPLLVGQGDFLVHGPQVLPRLAGLDAYSAAAAAWVSAIWRRSDAGATTSTFAPQPISHGPISTSPATSSRPSMRPSGRSIRCA